MQAQPEINQVFSTAVVMFQLGRDYTDEELQFLFGLARKKNTGNQSSVNSHVLRDPKMASLNSFVYQCVNQYFQKIFLPRAGLRLEVTQSWMNWTREKEYHHRHAHPNSFLSGVLYIAADEKTDSITFYNPRNTIPCNLGLGSTQYNVFNSHEFKLPVHTGHLLVFPSVIEHSVDTLKTDSLRASVAFNTFPVGVLGNDDEKTRLEIVQVN